MRQLTLDEMIDRYEAALEQSRWNVVDLRQYIPSMASTDYWPALVELLRIRMEHAFQEDPAQGVEQCVREFPGLLQKNELLSELAYEEYRLRQHAGHAVTTDEYRERWDIDTSSWKRTTGADEAKSSSSCCGSSTEKRSVHDISLVPGQTFGPFRILCLLGRGALAKVYLAQQLDLSERAVVLKVCSQATLEPQKIALLQHPHIVQIFSVHEVSGYQVLCMPYAGATTLADLLVSHRGTSNKGSNVTDSHSRTSQQLVTTLNSRQREIQTLVDNSVNAQPSSTVQLNHGLSWPQRWQSMRYEDIVCELMLQLAQGLAHAHHHGIVHSDLKPANVLIGDDGQARLVDFNVAQHDSDARRSLMGGTLPYMAPEHIRSLREDRWQAGPASDLYSLGVIAFQMLSGSLPFATPTGTTPDSLDKCLADRQNSHFKYRLTTQHASVDVQAVIEKLLEPQLDRRYKSAGQLAEDLQRHLQHLPLRFAANRSPKQRFTKWATRHPRISSATTAITFSAAGMLLMATALIYYRVQYRTEQAHQMVAAFQAELPTAMVMAAHYREYGDLEMPTHDATAALLSTLAEPGTASPRAAIDYLTASDKLLLAANLRELDKTLRRSGDENLTPAQLISLATNAHSLANRLHKDDDLDALIESTVDVDFREMTQATRAYVNGDTVRAIELLTALVERAPHQHAAWLLLGTCHQRAGETELADAAYATSLALMPNHWQGWYHRALLLQNSALHSQRADQLATAEAHYTRALRLRPDLASATFNRALCRESLGKLDEALTDANQLIEQSKELIRAHFLAARLLRKQGNTPLAEEHTRAALASKPASNRDYVYLGSAQLATDRDAAAENFRHAWELNPHDAEALQSLAYLAMELKSDDSANKWLDLWIAAAPLQAAPLASRAVFYARQGKLEQAIVDYQSALRLRPKPREQVQIASALVLMAEKTESADVKKTYTTQALTLLVKAVQSEWRLVSEVAQDADMKSIRGDSRFQSLVKTAIAFGQLPKLIEAPKP